MKSQLTKSHTSPNILWEDSLISPRHFRNLATSRLELKEHEHAYYNPSWENRLFEGRQIQIETVWFPEQFIH